MLVVFLIGVAPKEYLHELLYHHTDTVDPVYKKGEIVITAKHTHCSFLGFVFAPFVATEREYISFKENPGFTVYVQPAYKCHYVSSHQILSLRGPPGNS
jgi:formylmethanofuran dehydrogenase subunit D